MNVGNVENEMSSSGDLWQVVEVEWGWCGLRRGARGLTRCTLPRQYRTSALEEVADMADAAVGDPLLSEAARRLRAYFSGTDSRFDLPLELSCAGFSERVLRACAAIPWGETRSYGQLAAEAGSPGGARAAGQALGRNPLPVLIPCHRVISADGTVGGFSSGLTLKRRLLQHEGIYLR